MRAWRTGDQQRPLSCRHISIARGKRARRPLAHAARSHQLVEYHRNPIVSAYLLAPVRSLAAIWRHSLFLTCEYQRQPELHSAAGIFLSLRFRDHDSLDQSDPRIVDPTRPAPTPDGAKGRGV